MIKRVSIGDDITADKFNELVDALNRFRISGVGTAMVSGNIDSGFMVSIRRSAITAAEEMTSTPKPFDIKSNAEGKIKVHRCWFQHLSKWVELATEPEVAITTGRLCLCVDTSVDPLVVTLVINPTADPVNYPELKYFSLYKITAVGDPVATASIDFDLRANIIVTTYE